MFTLLKRIIKRAKPKKLSDSQLNIETTERVKGLKYVPEFVSEELEKKILEILNSGEWHSDLGRSVQHYGWLFEKQDRDIEKPRYLAPLPTWADHLTEEFIASAFTKQKCDYILVNKYQPGEGIDAHIDLDSCFSNYIFILSLSSSLVMELQNIETKQIENILLEARSLLCLTNDARYRWTHSIRKTHNDKFNGRRIERKERVSLTFRKVIDT